MSPSPLAAALLLRSLDKFSDAEAHTDAEADFGIRWKVDLGIKVKDRPLAKGTLQAFRSQLVLHDQSIALPAVLAGKNDDWCIAATLALTIQFTLGPSPSSQADLGAGRGRRVAG